MTTEDRDWERFCERAASVMRDALNDKISLEDASDFFRKEQAISDPDLRRYVESTVWEIDGSRQSYLELVELFEKSASHDNFVRYLNSKPSFWGGLSETVKATAKRLLSKLGISRG